ncbi:PulJ/GspJ family protein [Flavobacterium cerinum]|uniref:Prepilin-type N-terminal cleavage/methylation domain-containing protein n=1 Tax=Flavobacterium cerinum TaxID=2502784 RepID=A0ABY5IXR8_9FLAO|nr:hypothetical protein [Flavobacterium cerinum]UUC46503.1 hypothetical protein NOX80_04710 [Flavobacterium cerinum]
MKNKVQLRAFSMIEAIVGMAITAIIMSLIFVIFSIVTERMLDFKNQNQPVNDLNRLTYLVNKDIFENEKMKLQETALRFIGYSGEQVSYRMEETYLLRSNGEFVDTFRVQIKEIQLDSVYSRSKRLAFRKLKLKLDVNEKEMGLNFYKPIYASELLQATKEP